jgi:HAD superfamily hydrolase (TIGR01509 family)
MKAFIFDFDGVIVDSESHWKVIGDEEFFPSIVPDWTKADGENMMGLGVQSGYRLLTEQYGLRMAFDEYWKRLDACVGDIYTNRCALLPGVLGLMDRLDALMKPLGIASSSQRHWIEPSLERFHIRQRFRAVCAANDVNERTKPLPDVYLLAAKRLEVDPQMCVALEDSTNGLKAAKAARMKAIAIRTYMNEEQDLSQADLLIKHYDELTTEVLSSF